MSTEKMTRIALIAAVYTVLSLVLAPFSFGNIQVRVSEALTILPILFPESIYGLTLGCFLTNLSGFLMGVNPTGIMDAVIGTSATFLAAVCTYKLAKKTVKGFPLWSALMPIVFNFVFIGAELAYVYLPADEFFTGFFVFGAEVAVGETIAVALGCLLLPYLRKTKLFKA